MSDRYREEYCTVHVLETTIVEHEAHVYTNESNKVEQKGEQKGEQINELPKSRFILGALQKFEIRSNILQPRQHTQVTFWRENLVKKSEHTKRVQQNKVSTTVAFRQRPNAVIKLEGSTHCITTVHTIQYLTLSNMRQHAPLAL